MFRAYNTLPSAGSSHEALQFSSNDWSTLLKNRHCYKTLSYVFERFNNDPTFGQPAGTKSIELGNFYYILLVFGRMVNNGQHGARH